MKIYTKTGDRGSTSLSRGDRVSKAAQRVEAYGDIDELSSMLGVVTATLTQRDTALIEEIRHIQNVLLHICALLAGSPGVDPILRFPAYAETVVGKLEASIDRMEESLVPLKNFILPGGHLSAAWTHVARTVCRRAERHVVGLIESSAQEDSAAMWTGVLPFLNRLSDYLFVLARHINATHGIPDPMWEPRQGR